MGFLRVTCMVLVMFATVQAKPRQRCFVKHADFVFVLDSSSSIWRPDYDRQLEFVKDVVEEFNIGYGDDQSRVGIVTFSDRVHVQFYLNQYGEKKAMKEAISRIGYLTGGTNTAAAIRKVHTTMFKEHYGARSNVDHIAVVITDGKSKKSKDTLKEAELARAAGIQIFAIGVGSQVSIDELAGIASSPSSKFMHRVANYRVLNSIISNIATETCEEIEETTTTTSTTTTVPTTTPTTTSTTTTTTTTTPAPTTTSSTTTERTTTSTTQTPTTTTTTMATTTTERPQGDEGQIVPLCGGKPADVFFILDSSTSIWTVDFKKQLEFVKNVIRTFDVGPTKTRVGLSTFSDTVHPMIDFDQFTSKDQVLRAVDNVKYQSGLTYTGDAIEDMLNRAFAPGYARPGVAHIAVVITDGESREQQKTAEQALLAQNAGIYMFAIGVGKAVNEDELKAIASNPDSNYVYTVNSYDALDTLKHILAQKACEVDVIPSPEPVLVKDEPKCTRGDADLMFTIDSGRSSPYAARSIITLIDNVIRDLELSMLRLKVGLLQDVCVANSGDIALSSHVDAFRKQLNAIQYANLAALIHRLRTERSYMRDPSEKIAVLFVDDKLDQPKDTVKEAYLAKRQGIEIFVVAVGNNYVNSEVNSLCSAPVRSHVIRVPDYSQLLGVRQKLGQQICIPSLLRNAGLYY